MNSMNVTCQDRERILMDGSAEEWAALEAHAVGCAKCGEEVRILKDISAAAGEMRQEWESPYLWGKIERALTEQISEKPSRLRTWLNSLGITGLTWQTAAALALLIAVTGTTTWFYLNRGDNGGTSAQILLKSKAVDNVERAETAYQKAIDKLDAEARPQLDSRSTPLLASYREKLLVLDNAIDELRAEAGQNPGNAHLRRQLLAMYQEKQETLEEVLEAKR